MGTQAFNRLRESQAEVTSLGIEMDPKVLNNVEKIKKVESDLVNVSGRLNWKFGSSRFIWDRIS